MKDDDASWENGLSPGDRRQERQTRALEEIAGTLTMLLRLQVEKTVRVVMENLTTTSPVGTTGCPKCGHEFARVVTHPEPGLRCERCEYFQRASADGTMGGDDG